MAPYWKSDQLRQKPKPVPAAAKRAYTEARERQAIPGGYRCEYCGAKIKAGQEHAHHVKYGGNHGRKTESASDLAIVHGSFTTQDCHGVIHAGALKDRRTWPVNVAGERQAESEGVDPRLTASQSSQDRTSVRPGR